MPGTARIDGEATGDPVYTPRSPERTILHRTVCEQLEAFLARSRYRDQPTPRFVEQTLRSYLRCGVLAHGFLRLHCDDCGHDRLVAFSCYPEWKTMRSPREEGG
jgi:hypothetical protein